VLTVEKPSTLNFQGRGGNGFSVLDPNGPQAVGMSDFESSTLFPLRGFNVVDANNTDRMSAYLSGTTNGLGDTMTVTTRDQNGTPPGRCPKASEKRVAQAGPAFCLRNSDRKAIAPLGMSPAERLSAL
jgi:hypothetical protein